MELVEGWHHMIIDLGLTHEQDSDSLVLFTPRKVYSARAEFIIHSNMGTFNTGYIYQSCGEKGSCFFLHNHQS